MKKISASGMFVTKRLLPALWFGALALFMVWAISQGVLETDPFFMVGPLLMVLVGYGYLKFRVRDLVDEVIDCGDSLLVRNGGDEVRVSLSDLMNVNFDTRGRMPRITLRVKHATRLGSEIAFTPKASFSLNPFYKNPIAENLIARANQSRELHEEL